MNGGVAVGLPIGTGALCHDTAAISLSHQDAFEEICIDPASITKAAATSSTLMAGSVISTYRWCPFLSPSLPGDKAVVHVLEMPLPCPCVVCAGQTHSAML